MSYGKITLLTAILLFAASSNIFAGIPEDANVIKVCGGEYHTLIVTKNNWAWATGYNLDYQLGRGGTSTDPNKLLCRVRGIGDIGFLTDINDVAAGWRHSLALDINGGVLGWGGNGVGQLGDGTQYPRPTPVRVLAGEMQTESGYLEHIVAIAAGRTGTHSLALDVDGNCFGWGNNASGQLGVGEEGNYKLTPVKVLAGETGEGYLKDVCGISAGVSHSLACDGNGNALAWGAGSYGKLGTGDVYARTTPVRVRAGQQDTNHPENSLKNIVAVSAGYDHSMALEAYKPLIDPNCQGRVFCFGINTNGQLGDNTRTEKHTPVIVLAGQQNPGNPTGTYLTGIIAIGAGQEHSIALDVNGQVWSWGDNQGGGQLGNGSGQDSNTPVRVMRFEGLPLAEIVTISAGYWHNLAIDTNGLLWVWGGNGDTYNLTGALGLGDNKDKHVAYPRPPVFNLTRDRFQFGLQPAIDDACNLDVLEAQPGTYFEKDVDFRSKTLTLQSTDPCDWGVVEKTIVQAEPGYMGVKFAGNTSPLLQGFTIQNAKYGINCTAGWPLIERCLLRDNIIDGVYVTAGLPELRDCRIEGNSSVADAPEHGGVGVYGGGADVLISDCEITSNPGLGVAVTYGAKAHIQTSRISDNLTGVSFDDGTQLSVTNCIIADNTGETGYGNGIYLDAYADVRILDNWIYGNSGSAVHVAQNYYPPPIIRNNTMVFNSGYGAICGTYNSATITNCIIWGNASGQLSNCTATYSCMNVTPISGPNNISSDPCFVAAEANNFHLKTESLCIDAGDPAFNDFNETDIDGECRIMFGKNALRVDMGADEFYQPKADYNDDGIVNFIDFAMFALPWRMTDANISLDGDNDVDMNDLELFCDVWLWTAPWMDEYQQMMGMGGGEGQSQMMLPAGQELFMAEALESAPLQADVLTIPEPPPSVEDIIVWLDEAWKSGQLDIPEDEYLAFRKLLEEQLQ